MIVNEIMTTKVITIEMDDTLGQIQKIFEKHKFHHLLIVDDGELIGIISDRDVLKEISPYVNTISEDSRARQTLKKKAHQIMSRKPITVEPDTLVDDAASIMLKKNISCLPVVSPSGNIDGILSWKDILKCLLML
ncbi:MAG: CBS domain-containing protein [Candidatus Desulfatibia sp.]|uniref:CBS domain-containing protein n=1 Tax=Candidatus Desulfatibia sp. TaxID=3101189 RepID=UPI002F2C81F8